MRVFILEDDPMRIHLFQESLYGLSTVMTVTNVEDAKKEWNPPYDMVCLDHDLGGEQMVDSAHENTGMGFVRWLTEESSRLKGVEGIIIHSYNPGGAENMLQKLLNAETAIDTVKQPFGNRLLRHLTAQGNASKSESSTPE